MRKGFDKGFLVKFLVFFLVIISIIPIATVAMLFLKPVIRALPERLAARKIDKYPNANKWVIKTGCSDMFQTGLCYAHIYFKTSDSPNMVFDYYKEKLGSSGFRSTPTNYKVIDFYKGNTSAELTSREGLFEDTNYYFSINAHHIEP